MPFRFLFGRWARPNRFTFFDTGPLRDNELELIQPSAEWIDAVIAVSEHSLTRQQAPSLRNANRQQLTDFLTMCPRGRQLGNRAAGIAPAYHFWMLNHDLPALPVAGGIGLRVGHSRDLELYYGHVGYHVFPPHQGHRFAERAVRLLLPLIARHDLSPLWITCNPDNWPSRRTCERLGATLIDTVTVPKNHPLYKQGEKEKCRYRLEGERTKSA